MTSLQYYFILVGLQKLFAGYDVTSVLLYTSGLSAYRSYLQDMTLLQCYIYTSERANIVFAGYDVTEVLLFD